ncbi:MAG: shikimate kinase [Actinomycetaceae bacterium]|nr:shikimate kinase [Actinomycetaceae bacterium]
MKIILLALPGTDVQQIGTHLASLTGLAFVDGQELTRKTWGRTPGEIILEYGEDDFRALEQKLTSHVLTELAGAEGGIFAPTSGAFEKRPQKIPEMTYVYVRQDLVELARKNGLNAPRSLALGTPNATFRELAKKRDQAYSQLADLEIDGNGKETVDIAHQIACQISPNAL